MKEILVCILVMLGVIMPNTSVNKAIINDGCNTCITEETVCENNGIKTDTCITENEAVCVKLPCEEKINEAKENNCNTVCEAENRTDVCNENKCDNTECENKCEKNTANENCGKEENIKTEIITKPFDIISFLKNGFLFKNGGNTVNNSDVKTEVTPADNSETTENMKVFNLINEERIKNGVPELEYRTDIQVIPDKRAEEITRLFSHTRPNGTPFYTAAKENNISYRTIGENIAYGNFDADGVMKLFMNSEGHRENILSQNYTGVAVAFIKKGNLNYCVQTFIK